VSPCDEVSCLGWALEGQVLTVGTTEGHVYTFLAGGLLRTSARPMSNLLLLLLLRTSPRAFTLESIQALISLRVFACVDPAAPPPPHVSTSVHPGAESCSDLGSSVCLR